jgi:hypothetical protein
MSNISSPTIQQNPWVLSIKKEKNTQGIANLILDRLFNPSVVGPFFSAREEFQSEIIKDLWDNENEEFQVKIASSIEVIYTRLLDDSVVLPWKNNVEVLHNLFYLTEEFLLEDCQKHLYEWILRYKTKYSLTTDPDCKALYYQALSALSYIQEQKEEYEEFWKSLWNNENTAWHEIAFHGIIGQSHSLALEYLPQLIERNLPQTPYLLTLMWVPQNNSAKFEARIKTGMVKDLPWAGQALNVLADKLSIEKKEKILKSLRDTTVMLA